MTMTTWKRLLDYTERLRRGNLIRCVLEETPLILLLRDDGGLVAVTGQDAGTEMFHLPRDGYDSGTLSPQWLVENWASYVPSPAEDVLVRDSLEARELASPTRIQLAEYSGTLERGRLLECPFGYPFEGTVYAMVTEVDTRLGFMAITGYKAGIRAFWVPPRDAGTDAGLDPRWLVANATDWLFGGARLDGVFVRDPLTPAEI
jgi:hypothetical protein